MNGNKRKHIKEQVSNYLYNSTIVNKLLKNFMKQGKQYAAYKVLFNTFRKIKKNTHKNPNLLLHKSVYQQKLPIELISIKKSGRVYRLPMVVNPNRQFRTILKLFSVVTKENKKTTSSDVLGREIVDSLDVKKKTLVQKKLESTCRVAIDNQPFMHFRWSSKRAKRVKRRKKPQQITFS